MNITHYTTTEGGDWIAVTAEDFVDIRWGSVIESILIKNWKTTINPAAVKLSNGVVYDRNLYSSRWIRRYPPMAAPLTVASTPAECPVPSTTETDPATKIAEEQNYMNCRFQSLQHLMNDLQTDLLKRNNDMTAASMVRGAMRNLKLAQDDYLLVSRRRLSIHVNVRNTALNKVEQAGHENVLCRNNVCTFPNCACPTTKTPHER
jgi:hypothetical protein